MRDLFALSEIFPFWSGQLGSQVRKPLLAGIAAKRTELAQAKWVAISVVTTFDFDSVYEEIGELVGASDPEAGASVCHDLLEMRKRELFTANPSWEQIGDSAHPRSLLPATRTVLPDDPLPAHVCGVKVGKPELYDAVYVRCYVCSTNGEADPLRNLLAQLANAGFASLDEALRAYFIKIGKAE